MLLILLMACGSLSAQNWNEWFRQKKTQKKYLVQQIVALQLYMKQVKKGYDIVRKGWNTVQDITDGEFNLHRDFLNALDAVSPLVREDYRVAEILLIPPRMVAENRKVRKALRESGHIPAPEMQYVQTLHQGLAEEAHGLLEDLTRLMTHADLEMDDTERLQRLEVIYRAMLRVSGLGKKFNGQMLAMAGQRAADEDNLKLLQQNYDDEM